MYTLAEVSNEEVMRMRASDRAYATLLDEIQSGVLRPGAVLGEVEQAARLGVSRTPLREALGRLAADGLVAQQSPRVTVVTAIDADDIREIFEVRRALEESAARLAAERGDAAAFAQLAHDFARVDLDGHGAGADGRDAYYALIADFDLALDAAVANDYLTAALRTVRTHLVRVRRLARDNPARLAASVAEHRLIAAAISTRDADLAAHATHVHLHNALHSILESLTASTGSATGAPAAPVVEPVGARPRL
ncbi:putative HTH-type transcriptional regulator YdfH [Microbacterium trichothecenolyticum]|uniref:Putative HTH-type transcriptional regulator YdfH n=2 Tax=Microbacteriaceae TaxID=85023 RepID=A0A0M2H8P1_MICTR|nr:putative HTH-type transcriptional regulator YdfH [Microbacterium trichothecenolyticum]